MEEYTTIKIDLNNRIFMVDCYLKLGSQVEVEEVRELVTTEYGGMFSMGRESETAIETLGDGANIIMEAYLRDDESRWKDVWNQK